MPLGTASARLRKQIMFRLVQKLGGDARYRWGRGLETAGELSIEHKEPWLNIDPSPFWDPNNVAFSHLPRNTDTRRRGVERLKGEDGTEWCSGCKRFLSVDSFSRMNRKNRTCAVKYTAMSAGRRAVGRSRRYNSTAPPLTCGSYHRFQRSFALFLLKIVKIVETFAFGFCTLWVPSPLERELQADCKTE
jgi:hypothetical protein